MTEPKTLYDKIWDRHVVATYPDGTALIYVDRHLIHEVTSPQAFEGLRLAGRTVHDPRACLAVADHNIPTKNRADGIDDPESALQIETLEKNCREFGIPYYPTLDIRQGIVHIIGPEQGFTLPGSVIVCGDSHTSTHGAFGALAYGIGTSDVEHALAAQTLVQKKSANLRIRFKGERPETISAKDMILAAVGTIGTAGGTGCVIEYDGDAIGRLSMEQRMTICNMSIEAGARAGLIAPDRTCFDYLKGRPLAPGGDLWERAVAFWSSLHSYADAEFDREAVIDLNDMPPLVTWGTSPEDVVAVDGRVPDPDAVEDPVRRDAVRRALNYMGLSGGERIVDIAVDRVFIGSCTNGRIEDLRAAAAMIGDRRVSSSVSAMVVPGSGLVKRQAESEGLDAVFVRAGFEWRDPGCSMCLAMNADRLHPGERCASTSNRNFEGRQGRGGRTHLVSPPMAAAAAIAGRFVDIRRPL